MSHIDNIREHYKDDSSWHEGYLRALKEFKKGLDRKGHQNLLTIQELFNIQIYEIEEAIKEAEK